MKSVPRCKSNMQQWAIDKIGSGTSFIVSFWSLSDIWFSDRCWTKRCLVWFYRDITCMVLCWPSFHISFSWVSDGSTFGVMSPLLCDIEDCIVLFARFSVTFGEIHQVLIAISVSIFPNQQLMHFVSNLADKNLQNKFEFASRGNEEIICEFIIEVKHLLLLTCVT